MYQNPHIHLQIARQRQESLLAEAAAARLVARPVEHDELRVSAVGALASRLHATVASLTARTRSLPQAPGLHPTA